MPQPHAGEEDAAAIFEGACAACHTGRGDAELPRGIDLALSTAINDDDPRNAINIVLGGIAPPAGVAGPLMPGFAGTFSDAQLAGLLSYLRAHYGPGPAWSDLNDRVRSMTESRGRR